MVKGISTDLLNEACARAKIECPSEVVPWARAYYMGLNTPNTVVYTTSRKPNREALFHWVGPILPRATYFFGRPGSDMRFTTLDDIKRNAVVGVVRGDASETDLRAMGFAESALRYEADTPATTKLLLRGLVDVIIDTEIGAAWNLKAIGQPSSALVRLAKVSEEGPYYFAINLETDPALVRRLQEAVDALKHEGRLKAILRKYGVAK